MAQKGSGSSPRGGSGQGFGDGRTGRLAPEVYRRRRIVAAVVAGLLVVLLAVGIVTAVTSVLGPEEPGTAGEPEAAAPAATATEEPFADFTPRPDGSTAPTASAAPTPTAEPVEECGSALAVTASTDRQSYPPDVQPVLRLTLENTGEDPCRVNAGTSQMVYEVVSGRDTVFDSRHCQAEPQDREVTLDPGEEVWAELTWDLRRSLEGCAEPGEEAQPGHYRLVVSLGERTSEPVRFVLEG
jgi:hypothetical protein